MREQLAWHGRWPVSLSVQEDAYMRARTYGQYARIDAFARARSRDRERVRARARVCVYVYTRVEIYRRTRTYIYAPVPGIPHPWTVRLPVVS